MKISFKKDGVVITGKDLSSKLHRFGEPKGNGILIPRLAFLYMIEKGIITENESDIFEYDFQVVLKRFKRNDPKIFSKYLIFRDLVDRGYMVIEGYGKDIDLLVYDKGDYPEKPPSIRVIGVEEGEHIKVSKIVDELHFSNLNKKRLVVAVIERRGEVIYYDIRSSFGDVDE
jgi:tRNA-intron endonuclease